MGLRAEFIHKPNTCNTFSLSWRYNTFPVNSQLQSKRLRWLGRFFRMPNDRLLKKLLVGEVRGLRPPGRPKSNFNDVVLRDCQKLSY